MRQCQSGRSRDHEQRRVEEIQSAGKRKVASASFIFLNSSPFLTDGGHRSRREKIFLFIKNQSERTEEARMIDIKHLMKAHAYQNIPLTFEEAFELGEYALAGCLGNQLAQIQSIAALSALHTYGTYKWRHNDIAEELHGHRLPMNAAEQIAGVCAAVFEHDIARSEFGFLHPNVPLAMDNCGMGGDLVTTPNVSTLAAFIAAAAGIPMCKHGSPANADHGKYGSSDFIASVCGIDEYAAKSAVEKSVEQFCFGYTEALDTRYKRIHLQTHQVAQLPHMNDIIGPITNPVAPEIMSRRIIGVNHLIKPIIVIEALQILNDRGYTHFQRVFAVRGFIDRKHYRGVDEISICSGGTTVAELNHGEINESEWLADDFGVEEIPSEEISPVGNKGQFSLSILRREIKGPVIRFILANAAVLFYLAGQAKDLREGYSLAKQVYESGEPYRLMLAVREMLPKVHS
jgi:anthranilate phosphoribosyltransferase